MSADGQPRSPLLEAFGAMLRRAPALVLPDRQAAAN